MHTEVSDGHPHLQKVLQRRVVSLAQDLSFLSPNFVSSVLDLNLSYNFVHEYVESIGLELSPCRDWYFFLLMNVEVLVFRSLMSLMIYFSLIEYLIGEVNTIVHD